jgi:Tetratricopeptide repeat
MKNYLLAKEAMSIGALLAGSLFVNVARAADDAPAAATADKDATVAKLNDEGSVFYKARDYRRAVEKFIQAYAMEPDPNLLFNIARCYDFLGDTDAAIEKYELFLKTPGADTIGRQRAQASLRTLRTAKNAGTPEKPAATLPEAPPSAPMRPTEDPNASHTASGSSTVLPWVMLGTGVVVTTFGATMYVLGAHDHDSVKSAPGYGDPQQVDSMSRAKAQDLVDSGTRKKTIGGIGLGVGGALVVTSFVLFLSNSSSETSDRGVAFAVGPTPGGGAVALNGRF